MSLRSSKFVPFQEIKVQEPSDQVPIGHVPRAVKVRALGALSRQCTPGDSVVIQGVFMPAPFFGFRAPSLIQDTFVEAFEIRKEKITEHGANDETLEKVMDVRAVCNNDNEVLERVASSICPEIFGLQEVKQAILL